MMDMEALVTGEMDFAIVLEEVFGPKSAEFSEDLRSLLKEMWERGIESGVYAKDEKVPVPEEVVLPRRLGPREDETPRSERKLNELVKTKNELVEAAEILSVRLDHAIDPSLIGKLEGDALTKGVHNFLTRTARIKKKLDDALLETERFRVYEV